MTPRIWGQSWTSCLIHIYALISIQSLSVALAGLKSTGCSRDVKGLLVCFLAPWVIARAKDQRCRARNSLTWIVQREQGGSCQIGWSQSTRPHSIHLSFCLSASLSHSVCRSICRKLLHTGERDTLFTEGWVYLSVHRQEMAIYRLLSPHWKSHKLPLSSLWAVSTATVFCFSQWQERRVQNEIAGLDAR